MSAGIEARIDIIDNGRVQVRLDQFPKKLKRELKKVIGTLARELLSRVQAAQPQRTGLLRRSTHAFVSEGVDWVRGRVRVTSASGLGARFGALEYGGPGIRRRGQPVEVRAYSRAGVRVSAYERKQPRIRERRFLRGPAQAHRAHAKAILEAALTEAIANFNKE